VGFRVAAFLLLPILGAVGVQADGAAAPGPLPAVVGDISTWTIVSGEFDNGNARGHYRFYVSPGRQGIYRLMRYDVQFLVPGNELERSRQSGERLVFVERPGSRQPLLCWQWDSNRGAAGSWRPVPPGTDAYQLEMITLVRVLAVHRGVRRQSER